MYGAAEGMRNSGVGYQPYMGQVIADISPYTAQGWDRVRAGIDATGGAAGPTEAMGLARGMVANEGISTREADVLSRMGVGQQGNVGQNYVDLYNEASGAENPYLKDIMAGMEHRIGDKINSSFSGSGRYGSGQYTDVMSRALSEAEAPVLAQDYARRQAQRMGATEGLGKTFGQMQNAYESGLGRAGQWAQAMPGFMEAAQMPGRQYLAMGEYDQNRQQQQLDEQRKLYNAQQSYPWEQLFRESAILSGAGGLGGTTITGNSQAQPSMWQKILGGGLAGGGLGSSFGPMGAGVGALGGAALGGLL
jgi:hypothetical protein